MSNTLCLVKWFDQCSKEPRSWVHTPCLMGLVQSFTSQIVFCANPPISIYFAGRQLPVQQSYIEFVSALLHNRSRVFASFPICKKVSNFPAPPPRTVAVMSCKHGTQDVCTKNEVREYHSQLVFCTNPPISLNFACQQPPVQQSYIEFVSACLHNRYPIFLLCPLAP